MNDFFDERILYVFSEYQEYVIDKLSTYNERYHLVSSDDFEANKFGEIKK